MLNLIISLILSSYIYSESIVINLITTNDVHGIIGPQKANFMNPQYPPTIIGGSAFSKYVDEIRLIAKSNNEGILILDGGNFFQGSPLGISDNGATMIEWMNRIGYDAIVPGHYDFISGAQNLNSIASIAKFPFLFSNLTCNECPIVNNNFKPYIIKNISGINVGILGVVNSKLEELVLAENLSNTIAENEIKSIKKWIPEIKSKGADVIIILTSSGVPWNREEEYTKFIKKIKSGEIDSNSSLNAMEMAYFLEDIDFIVAGGNSKGYPLPWYDPNSHIYVIQGYGGGSEFSHIKLIIDKKSHLFQGYKTVIDGRASQTLLADDFKFNLQDEKWINSKLKESDKLYFNRTNKRAYNTNSPLNIKKNNWDFPNLNKNNSLEIVTWNWEFFPTANDSTINTLAEAIYDMNVDIIAIQEIRRTGWLSKLMAYLPQYDFIVSEQASFMDLAIIYKNDLFSLNRQFEPFSDDDYNFAGRPPLQADLTYNNNNNTFDISIINLHMKCCDSGLSRRKKAAKMLHKYVNYLHDKQPNIIVLGDWNDDTKDKLGEHCFEPFFNDDLFYFITKEIAYDIEQATYPKKPYISFLDHILISNHLLPKLSNYEIKTILMGEFMGGYDIYEKYISDHRPVMLSFSVTK